MTGLASVADRVIAGLAANGWVALRDHPLQVDQQVELARSMGVVLADRSSIVPRPEVRWEVDAADAGSADPARRAAAARTFYNEQWHADMSWAPGEPPVTILAAETADPGCATTELADLCTAPSVLATRRLEQIRPWQAVHHVELSRQVRYGLWERGSAHRERAPHWRLAARHVRAERRGLDLLDRRRSWLRHVPVLPAPGLAKTLVDVDPRRCEEFVRVGDHTWTIVGMEASVGLRELQELEREVMVGVVRWTHEWRPGDLVAFDNRALLHRRRPPSDPSARRVVRRVVVWPRMPAAPPDTR